MQQKNIKIIVISLVVILAGAFFWTVTNRYLLPLRAAGEPVPCFFNKTEATASGSGEIEADIFCQTKTEQKISGVTATIQYDQKALTFVDKAADFASSTCLANNFKLTTKARVANDSASGTVSVSRLLPDGADSLPSGLFCAGTMVFSTKSTAGTTITLDKNPANWEIVGPGGNYSAQIGERATMTIGGGKQTSGGVALGFDPRSKSGKTGETFKYDLIIVNLDIGGKISGWDVTLKVGQQLDFVSAGEATQDLIGLNGEAIGAGIIPDDMVSPIDTGNPGADTGLTKPTPTTVEKSPSPAPKLSCQTLIKKWDPQAHTLRLSTVCISSDLPSFVVIPLSFKALSNGSGTIDYGNIQIVGSPDGELTVLSKDPASYTIGDGGPPVGGGGGSGNVKIDSSLKFQGILKKPARSSAIDVQIGVAGGNLSTPVFGKGSFIPQDDGVYTGSVSLNVPAGSGYYLLVKGPYHLQKKVCVVEPKETFPGTYSCSNGQIALEDGTNILDASNIYLLVGDLPDQDGIVNSADISLVRNLLGKSDAESVRLADLNYDGTVNAQDYSLVIAALSVRQDEQ